MLRLSLLYHYGGWFSDLDVVFLRPLSSLPHNCLSSGQIRKQKLFGSSYNGTIGRLVNGAIFHFDRGHVYLTETMAAINATYSPQNYISVGPLALTAALKTVCGSTEEEEERLVPFAPESHPPERCAGIHITPQYIFYPVTCVLALFPRSGWPAPFMTILLWPLCPSKATSFYWK